MSVPDRTWGSTRGPRPGGGASAGAALRHSLLWASRQPRIQRLVVAAPVTRSLVRRFVAGEEIADAIATARDLAGRGLTATIDHLGEDTRDAAAATATVDVYRTLLGRLREEGLAESAEVSVKLSALGQAIDEGMALDNASRICEAAAAAGTTVTFDMEGHDTTDSTLRAVAALRADFPWAGAVIQASLHRSEADCRSLAAPGSRVRLCKGAYQEPATLAWQRREEVRDAYVRCLRILVGGGAYAMIATHDPVLVDAAARLLRFTPRTPGGHEYQMLLGIRPDEQRRLAAAGERVRVYVPFGHQWYAYLMRRMAERPANLALVLRALSSRG